MLMLMLMLMLILLAGADADDDADICKGDEHNGEESDEEGKVPDYSDDNADADSLS